jgi:membrane dipeptidase
MHHRKTTTFTVVILLITSSFWCFAESKAADQNLADQVRLILRKSPLIDGHNDLPEQLKKRFNNHWDKLDLNDTSKLDPPMHTDIPRLKAGGVGAQFWSVYVSVDLKGADAAQAVLEQIDDVYRMVERYPQTFKIAYTADDIQKIHGSGKIASLIGVEGGHCINNSLAVLRQLYMAGARYMTLTHRSNTDWADAATAPPKFKGLNAFGEDVVHEMNRLGMLIDLSHVSADTMNKVLDISQAPVIFSHSSARAIDPHVRNVPDDVLKRIPQNGGVVMVNFAPSFVSEQVRQYEANKKAQEQLFKSLYLQEDDEAIKKRVAAWAKEHPAPKATLSQLADHIDHIKKVAGVDYIGIGSDFDGIETTSVGLEDVSKFPDLLAELMRRGYTKDEIKKIAGLNLLRALKKTEQIASSLQRNSRASDILFEDRKTETLPK